MPPGAGKLPPSERWKNYASAFMTIWPAWIFVFGLLGYTNKDHIRDWVGLAEADGKTEVSSNGLTFEQSVEKFSREVRDELIRIEQNSAAIRKQMEREDRKTLEALQTQIDELKRWHE